MFLIISLVFYSDSVTQYCSCLQLKDRENWERDNNVFNLCCDLLSSIIVVIGKLTISTPNSNLDPWRLKYWVSRVKLRELRIEIQECSFERNALSKCENIKINYDLNMIMIIITNNKHLVA